MNIGFAGRAHVVLSLGETEALAAKAARGAGMDWGLAEEAGRATRWLASRGLDGLPPLLRHLEGAQGADWRDRHPRIARRVWSAPDGALCPVAFGTALCDHCDLGEGPHRGGRIEVGRVSSPGLVLPFLALLSRSGPLRLTHEKGQVVASNATFARSEALLLLRTASARLTIEPCEIDCAEPSRGEATAGEIAPGPVSADVVEGLEALALRTTVPASDASRAGAGAGRDDD